MCFQTYRTPFTVGPTKTTATFLRFGSVRTFSAEAYAANCRQASSNFASTAADT